MQSEDVDLRSQADFALESPKIKLQLGANPVSGREIGTAYFNDGKSEADRDVTRQPGLLERSSGNQDYSYQELKTLNNEKPLKAVTQTKLAGYAEIKQKSLARHQDAASENTDFQPKNKSMLIHTREVEAISEASEFTYQQEASQRILLETKHCKDDDTVEGEFHSGQVDYINVASDTEEMGPRSDFSRGSSMRDTMPKS